MESPKIEGKEIRKKMEEKKRETAAAAAALNWDRQRLGLSERARE